MQPFDIIEYISSLTNFVLEKGVYERIALDRNVSNVTDYNELEQEQKDLLLADVLFVAYTSPTVTASMSNAHGSNKVSVGSQSFTTRKYIYNTMVAIYRKYEDDKLLLIETDISQGSLTWI